jgi:hypothetical protein
MSGLINVAADPVAAYFATSADGTPHVPTGNDAYVHVRLTEAIPPNGWMVTYLSDGSALVVPSRDLVILRPTNTDVPSPFGIPAGTQDPKGD